MAVGAGSVWVTNTGAGTISRIDQQTRAVVDTIEVGRSPVGIAVTDGAVWVANSGDRTISRINPATGSVVDTIIVGNGPTAVAAGAGSVWVANATDSTVVRVDARSGAPGQPISVASLPVALAVDDRGVWVVSQDGAAVTHLDSASGVTLAAPIALSARPNAVAIGGGAVWVAGSDGTVVRIDPAANRITATVDVGGSLSAIIASDGVVWAADVQGAVYRLDAANPALPTTRIATASAGQALTFVERELWVATRASPASHRGGTLRIVSLFSPELDPAASFLAYNFASLQADGLVAYRRVGGILGSTLLPDLATSIPRPTDGGKSYAFQLRAGLVYADGTPVMPDDFRRGIERAFQVALYSDEAVGPRFYSSVIGADACADAPLARCDLSAGIVTDTSANTVTFHLSEPDPDFLSKLALVHAYPVPANSVPMDAPVLGAFPGTGPYVVSTVGDNEIRLTRNPLFVSWNEDVRPDGLADEIVWTHGIEPDEQLAMVERGEADYMVARFGGPISPEAIGALRAQSTVQVHPASISVTFAFLNTTLPPFDSLQARQAVSMAIDRAQLADLSAATLSANALGATITCQMLPPGWPGYHPYCPYTTRPDPGGQWRGPDLGAARRLVDASGTQGATVMVGPILDKYREMGAYLVTVLRDLGYEASLAPQMPDEDVYTAVYDKRVQIGIFEWFADNLTPAGFLAGFTCDESDELSNYCDPALDALVAEARELQTTDAAAATAKWAEVDRAVVDLALWAPFFNAGADIVSTRVGNFQLPRLLRASRPALGAVALQPPGLSPQRVRRVRQQPGDPSVFDP